MITFKSIVKKDKQRRDKTWNVLIRVTYNRQSNYISTSMYVNKNALTTSFKIKDYNIIERCNELISYYQKKLSVLKLEENTYTLDYIINFLREKNDLSLISFTEYFEGWKEEHKNIKGIKNYISAINSFSSFIDHSEIGFDDITVNSIKSFENYLSDKARAASLYPSSIARVFNDAREHFNDYDNNIIRIKHSLVKYKVPHQNISKKRALTTEQIRSIFALPYNNKSSCGYTSRRDLALDCAKLSFCLGGMNSVDLFSCSEYKNGYIRYHREKTKDRRKDNAFMEIKIPGQIKYTNI